MISPSPAERLHAQAVSCAEKSDFSGALALLDQSIQIEPQRAAVHADRGAVLYRLRRLPEALESFDRALTLAPAEPSALNNRGAILNELHRNEEALESFDEAISGMPGYAEAYYNRGNALRDLKLHAQALASYDQAIALQPDYAKAWSNRGSALHELRRYGEAIASYDRAVSIAPRFVEALNNRANTLRRMGRLDEAIASYRAALSISPDAAVIHDGLIFTLLRSSADPVETQSAYARFAERFEQGVAPREHHNTRDPERRLTIGYVSADFRRHPVASHFEPVLANHDHGAFDVVCYANQTESDETTERLARHADKWRPVADLSDEDFAAQVQADRVDILVDLSGHTVGNRLTAFAHKPAPVQVTWLGLPASTGLRAIDFRLTDREIDPPGLTERYHSEKLYRLSSHACFNPEALQNVNALPALANGYVSFGSFNELGKISQPAYALWARVMRALPDSRLIMLCEPDCESWVRGNFERHGIEQSRVRLIDRLPLNDYLRLHGEVDLLLDSIPFNGGTISRYALWMGVPVLTLAGKMSVSRVGQAIMSQLELSEFVAPDEEGYVKMTMRWARDMAGLADIRSKLRDRTARALFSDGHAYARELERAYREMWKEWCVR